MLPPQITKSTKGPASHMEIQASQGTHVTTLHRLADLASGTLGHHLGNFLGLFPHLPDKTEELAEL